MNDGSLAQCDKALGLLFTVSRRIDERCSPTQGNGKRWSSSREKQGCGRRQKSKKIKIVNFVKIQKILYTVVVCFVGLTGGGKSVKL